MRKIVKYDPDKLRTILVNIDALVSRCAKNFFDDESMCDYKNAYYQAFQYAEQGEADVNPSHSITLERDALIELFMALDSGVEHWERCWIESNASDYYKRMYRRIEEIMQ